MTTKVQGTNGIEFPDGSVQSTAADMGPAFRALNSGPTAFTSGVAADLEFSTEVFDTDNCFAANRFTPNVAGYYQVNLSIMATCSPGTMVFIQATIRKNGVRSAVIFDRVPNATDDAVSVSDLIYCNGTTDYIDATILVTGTNPTVNAGVGVFSGALVRKA